MRRIHVEIDRLQVTAGRMPAAAAAAALAGLAGALRARLERVRWSEGAGGRLDVDELAIPPPTAPPDAALLRDAIADGIAEEVRRLTSATGEV